MLHDLNFKKDIKEAVTSLLDLARGLSWNNISDNCKFILTEIKDSEENAPRQRQLRKKVNDNKVPMPFSEIISMLESLYDNLYDINLYIHRAKQNVTIIDIQYYPKSTIDETHRRNVLDNPPMLHCKVKMPPWLSDNKKKFDINWEHHEGLNTLKRFVMKLKLKTHRG